MEGFMNESGFEPILPKGKSSIIKVIGVGGGGNNALKHMYERGIYGVDFVICNTDAQTLNSNPVANKVQLGASITEGLGAGADPEVGEKAAIESMDDIKRTLDTNTKMVFITAGMGGGTGTGAAPVVAKIAKEMGILTVAIVTVPFDFEGKRRLAQAEAGLEKLRANVDSLIVINNDKVAEQFPDLDYEEAFFKADEVLTNAAKGMSEVITAPFKVNIDFKDAKSVLENSGTALMSIGVATGEKRAEEAVRKALDSPLLNNNQITGAKNVLLLILSGSDDGFKAKMSEIKLISNYIQKEAGGDNEANIILGIGKDEELGEAIKVLVVATGFTSEEQKKTSLMTEEPTRIPLGDELGITNFATTQPVVKAESNPASEMGSTKKVFKLDDNTDFSVNTPTNAFQEVEEVETLVMEEEPMIETQEEDLGLFSMNFNEEPVEEKPKKEYDLFSYNDENAVSFTFDLEEKNTDVAPKIEEEPSIDFQLSEVEEEPTIEEIPVFEVNEKPVAEVFTPVQEEKEEMVMAVEEPKQEIVEVSQKEEFTIIERRNPEELAKIQERRNKLKEFNSRYHIPEEVNEFETIPAFKRRNLNLDLSNASEQKITSFISEENGKMKLKENRFLNKDVD